MNDYKPIKNFLCILTLFIITPIQAERIKDVSSVQGVRVNQLIGYGLVVGLTGTGDQGTAYTSQSIKNMLTQLGVTLPSNVVPQPKNVAAVSVTANLPPFAKPGQTIDVTVASIGSAKSLRGGSLLLTPLKGVDGNIYAIAQGELLVSGLGAEGKDGSKVIVNVPSAGRIPNGATVERAVPSDFQNSNLIVLNLHNSDFTTAQHMVQVINKTFGPDTANPMDSTSIRVRAPLDPNQKVGFLAALENLELEPGEGPAKVVINSRTGTVVVGSHVKVMPAAISHGNITLTINESDQVSQPAPLSQGQTVVTPNSNIKIEQEKNRMFLFKRATTLDEIVRAVNQVGAAPGDVVAILEALKEAGALRAELIVI